MTIRLRILLLLSLAATLLTAQEKERIDILQSNPLLVLHNEEQKFLISNDNVKPKSVFLAVGMSLLVPGTGEWYVGNISAARTHLFAEGGIWITYTFFRLRSNWLREDAHTFARAHAGATFDGTDDAYEVNIGNYMSVDDYNEAKLRFREYDLLYTDSRYAWQWDSDANRQVFKTNRIKSSEAKNNAKFVLAAAVLNRLISAFRAGRMASAYNSSLTERLQFDIHSFSDGVGTPGIKFSVSTSF